MAEVIDKLLSWPGTHIIVVFLTPSADAQFQGEPIQRVKNTLGILQF